MKKFLPAVLIAVLSLNANAAVTLLGVSSCGAYVKSVEDNVVSLEFAWIVGYLSGLSAGTGVDLLKNTDGPSIRLWIEKYCRSNPLKSVDNATNELAIELARMAGKRSENRRSVE